MIPGDPFSRAWVQASFTGPHGLDNALLSLIAFDNAGEGTLVGSGFIISAMGRSAVAMTATHSFDLVSRVQGHQRRHHLTTPSEFLVAQMSTISVNPEHLRAIYRNGDTVDLCRIGEVYRAPELDIALFTVSLQDHVEGDALAHRLSVDTRTPQPGEQVATLAYERMKIEGQQLERGERKIKISRNIALRRGVITDIHPTGGRLAKWPSFETSIPVDPGMSGGPCLWYGQDGQPMVACGVISSDFSAEEAWESYKVPGCSTMSMIWPSMGLSVLAATDPGEVPTRMSLLDLVERNLVDDVSRDTGKVQLQKHEDGRVSVVYLRD